MSWLRYLFKTSMYQKKQDWAEFKELDKEVRRAEYNVNDARMKTARAFFEEDSYDEVPACIKWRVMYGRSRVVDGPDFEYVMMTYDLRRCTNFAPVDEEQLCPCVQCGVYPANKNYFQKRQILEQKIIEKKCFWKNKFNQKTK